MVTLYGFWGFDVAFIYLEPAKFVLYANDTGYTGSLTQFFFCEQTKLTETKIYQWKSWFSINGLVSTATFNEHTIE